MSVDLVRNDRQIPCDDVRKHQNSPMPALGTPGIAPGQPGIMQEAIMVSIVRQKHPTLLRCVQQLTGVWGALMSFFVSRRGEVSSVSQQTRQTYRYVFIKVKRRHYAASLAASRESIPALF